MRSVLLLGLVALAASAATPAAKVKGDAREIETAAATGTTGPRARATPQHAHAPA